MRINRKKREGGNKQGWEEEAEGRRKRNGGWEEKENGRRKRKKWRGIKEERGGYQEDGRRGEGGWKESSSEIKHYEDELREENGR